MCGSGRKAHKLSAQPLVCFARLAEAGNLKLECRCLPLHGERVDAL